ncbi:MAG: choice-of-anchor D domain-containing protein [Proteobacteria bacterium]|nr:choice-of-anchor D domain-containing protein [Pseudomonadota bacterium]
MVEVGGAEVRTFDAGEVAVGDTVDSLFTLRNVGDDTLQIESLSIDGSSSWTIVEPPTPLLASGTEDSFTVRYSPGSDELVDARLVILSNDPDEPEVAVRLLADGIAPAIAVEPASYDFGNPEIGCVGDVEFVIANVGRAPLTLAEVSFDDFVGGGELALVLGVDVDTVLNPDESVTVIVRHEPTDVAPDSAALRIVSDDPANPELAANVTGTAHPRRCRTTSSSRRATTRRTSCSSSTTPAPWGTTRPTSPPTSARSCRSSTPSESTSTSAS